MEGKAILHWAMPPLTLVDHVERELRSEIVHGLLAPSSRLGVRALVDRYATGATPIREALSRLVGEGLVELTANKGFRVPGLSRADLEDVVAARTAIEVEALRLSMQTGDDRWEAGIIASLHRFRRQMERCDDGDGVPVDAPAHDDFHVALIGAARAPRLLALQQQFLVQHKRYMRLSRLFYIRDQHVQEHSDLAEIVLSRNVEAAITMMRQHLRLSIDTLDEQDYWAAT